MDSGSGDGGPALAQTGASVPEATAVQPNSGIAQPVFLDDLKDVFLKEIAEASPQLSQQRVEALVSEALAEAEASGKTQFESAEVAQFVRRAIQNEEASSVGSQPISGASASLRGQLLFDDKPVTAFTKEKAQFNYRIPLSGQTCAELGGSWQLIDPEYDGESGDYRFTSLAPGRYCLWVSIDAAEPFGTKGPSPGDFIADTPGYGQEVNLVDGES